MMKGKGEKEADTESVQTFSKCLIQRSDRGLEHSLVGLQLYAIGLEDVIRTCTCSILWMYV